MSIKYRTFEDGDEDGIVKLFNSAFCQQPLCHLMTREFWEWKYKKRPPRFIPEGILIAEKKRTIVGSVIVTFHRKNFGEHNFLFGGIDDVATCPVLQKRGIARNLMEKAIDFTKNYGADASVLMADPRGHARRLYKKLGYVYNNYFSIYAKIINPLKIKNDILPLTPFIPLFFLLNIRPKFKKYKFEGIQFKILKDNQTEFLNIVNRINKKFLGSNLYNEDYWLWCRRIRPKRHKGIVLAVNMDKRIVGGGTIVKSFFRVYKYYITHYVLSDLFVNNTEKIEGMSWQILKKLEAIASLQVPLMLAFVHQNNFCLNKLLKENGYISVQNAELEMINPFSKKFIEIYNSLKDTNRPWVAPLEQAGY
ncbi:MAG: GNAT family N-acetyltransferase [Candidatus Helarchaeota archaeon]